MTQGERNKVVVFRDIEDGYRWRLRSAAGETLAAASTGHREKSSCTRRGARSRPSTLPRTSWTWPSTSREPSYSPNFA